MKEKTRIQTWELEIDRRARLRIPATRLDYRPAKERIQDFDEVCLGFSEDTAREEASRCIECPEPQGCMLACPLQNDIPTAVWEISQGNFLEAAEIFRETSNFPELCGRLCPDECLCAGSCGVGKFHPDIRLGQLEAFVADYQRKIEGGIPIPDILLPTSKRVAVVGTGPAGLTAAEELSKLGYTVTIFEMRSQPGGRMIYEIPRFRLPIEVVKAKVAQLEGMGVEFVFETCVGLDLSVDDLFQRGYQAVFLGTGSSLGNNINLSGTELEGVWHATDFLNYSIMNEADLASSVRIHQLKDKQVVVFGCSYTAVDCARTAIRMGAQKVTCFHPRCELDKLCRIEDIIAAQEEGVLYVPLVEPICLIGDDHGRVMQAQCQRMGSSDINSQAQLTPIKGAVFLVDADMVILAPGRGPDSLIPETTPGLHTDTEGWVLTDKETGKTTRRGVFAAGGNTGQTPLVAVSIAETRKVTVAIHQFLTGCESISTNLVGVSRS